MPLPIFPAPGICPPPPTSYTSFPDITTLKMETTGLLQCWQYSHAPVCTEHVAQHSTAILHTACTTETGCLMFTIHSAYFWSNNIAVLKTSEKQMGGGSWERVHTHTYIHTNEQSFQLDYKDILTLRLLMSYIYIHEAPILDVSRSHTTMHHSR